MSGPDTQGWQNWHFWHKQPKNFLLIVFLGQDRLEMKAKYNIERKLVCFEFC